MTIHELRKEVEQLFPPFDNIFLKMPKNSTPFIAYNVKKNSITVIVI